jgi:hypothetical protein
MGFNFIDQYSLLHFAFGIIAYFFGIKFHIWLIIHLMFELIENSELGIKYINTWFKPIWPGGKDSQDALINSTGDQIFAMCGWLIAYASNK